MGAVIVGAGGHGQVVADILFHMEEHHLNRPIGFVDDDVQIRGHVRLDLPILGTISELGDLRFKNLIVGIGDNRSRRRIFTQLRTEYKIIPLARHPSAVVAPEVTIGMGTVICAGVIVNPGSVIGENVILNTGCVVEHHNEIGSHSHIGPGACLGGDVIVGEETLVGIGATVMPGVRIGTRSVVGAGALVRNDVPDGTAVAGVPAKEMRTGAIP